MRVVMDDISVSSTESANIGFCFGEGMSSNHIAMWRRTTPAAHPWLPFTEDSRPSVEECLTAGYRLAQEFSAKKR